MLWWCSRYISKCNMREGSLVPKMFWLPFNLFFYFKPSGQSSKRTDQKVKCSAEIEASFAIMTVERKKFSKPLVWCRKANQVKRKTRTSKKTKWVFSALWGKKQCHTTHHLLLLFTRFCSPVPRYYIHIHMQLLQTFLLTLQLHTLCKAYKKIFLEMLVVWALPLGWKPDREGKYFSTRPFFSPL